MSKAYHWTPDQINQLDFPQIFMYLDDPDAQTPLIRFPDVASAAAYSAQRKAELRAEHDGVHSG